jgi:hypothetical protein
MSVNVGGRFVAITVSMLPFVLAYMFLVWLRLVDIAGKEGSLPAGEVALCVITATLVPLAVWVLEALVGVVFANPHRRQISGFLFVGSTLTPDLRVSPSRPFGIAESRTHGLSRTVLLGSLAAVGTVAASAQLATDGNGSFPLYWVGAMAAGWCLFGFFVAIVEVLAASLWRAPSPHVRARRLRIVSVGFLLLAAGWLVLTVVASSDSMFAAVSQYVIGWPLTVGLVVAALYASAMAGGQRIIARDLRHVAAEAVVVSHALAAGDALATYSTAGFLLSDDNGKLIGWASRDDAGASPDSPLATVAHPLLDSAPISAEQRAIDLKMAIDPHLDAGSVVAIAVDGTPVGYVEVLRAFEYVTGDPAWTKNSVAA